MYLYVASQSPLGEELPRCCATGQSDVCLTTEPPKGQGRHLYRLSINSQALLKYGIRSDAYHSGPYTYVHLPSHIAQSFPKAELAWSEAWNEFIVTLPAEFEGANIWISRLGISKSEWVKEGKSLKLVLTEDFDPVIDWVVIEYLAKPKWELSCIAGISPYWTIFPRLWKEWVQDPDVRRSAIEFIAEKYPNVAPAVEHALRARHKSEQIAGWLEVAELLVEKARISPVLFYGYSATKIAYMPIRIAQRLGWSPPVEKPRPADLDKEERNLLATLGTVEKEEDHVEDLETFFA